MNNMRPRGAILPSIGGPTDQSKKLKGPIRHTDQSKANHNQVEHESGSRSIIQLLNPKPTQTEADLQDTPQMTPMGDASGWSRLITRPFFICYLQSIGYEC